MASVSYILLVIFMCFAFSDAREILVGGFDGAWKIPTSPSDLLNIWAFKERFNIGDTLVWKYDGKNDSVLEVTRKQYEICNTKSPIKNYTDGNTKIVLDRTGTFYFISGAAGHCERGQKFEVIVIQSLPVPPQPAAGPTPSQHAGPPGHSPAPSPNEAFGLKSAGLMGSTFMGLVGLAWML